MNVTPLPKVDTQAATGAWVPPTWIFTYRGFLAHLPLFFALFWIRGETPNGLLAWSLGLSLLVLGTAVRVWAQQHIHHRWESPMRLTASGPYQMIRNPLYIGNTLNIVGCVVCSRLLWFALPSLLWCALIYSLVVRCEEHGLLQTGEAETYRGYLQTVPRWLPRRLAKPEFVNEYFARSVGIELQCFLMVLPFVAKDLLVSTAAGQALLRKLLGYF